MKKFIIAAALIAAAASPSFAATTHHRHLSTSAPTVSGSNAMMPASSWATDGSQVLGADPDAFIRGQLVRAGNPGDLEGN